MKQQGRSRTERSLRGILVSVLAMPTVAAIACSSSKSDVATSGDASATGQDGSTLADAETGAPPDKCAAEKIDGAPYDDSGTTCSVYLKLPCGLPSDSTTRFCVPDLVTCQTLCPTDILYRCSLVKGVSCDEDGGIIPDADTLVECIQCPGAAGRRPIGLASARPGRARSALGAYFAELAHLEAASVVAFEDLTRALAALGAPASLQRAATRAAQDERRHAGETTRLARRFGAEPASPRVDRAGVPSLEELLAHNAVEGCVGESFGALLAMFQAARAADPTIARAMHGIARDEAEHAALSWDLLRWGAARVAPEARRDLLARIEAAAAALASKVTERVDRDVELRAGHPDPVAASSLADRFVAFVRSESAALLAA